MSSKTKMLKRKLLAFDILGENVNFNVGGQSSHQSVLGLVVSLAIFVLVGAYGFKKFIVMLEYQETTI